jgi:hypothetical protein
MNWVKRYKFLVVHVRPMCKWRLWTKACLNQVCSMITDTGMERKLLICSFWLAWMFRNRWKLLTKYYNRWCNMGLQFMTLKISNHNRYPLPHQDQKKHPKYNVTKVMLIVFFDYESTVFHKVTLLTLKLISDALNHKWLQKWESSKWQVCQDNAPAHSNQLVQ